MTATKAVAMRVSNLLVERNMSKYAYCKKIAMHEQTLIHIMNEHTKTILLDTVILLAQGFDMTLSEFFNDPLFNPENFQI